MPMDSSFQVAANEIFTDRPNGILEVDITCICRPTIHSTIECSVTECTQWVEHITLDK